MKATEVLRLYETGRRDFKGVSLREQNFQGKDLSGADFSGADIRGTNFSEANLTGANFSNAIAGMSQSRLNFLVAATIFLLTALGTVSSIVIEMPLLSMEVTGSETIAGPISLQIGLMSLVISVLVITMILAQRFVVGLGLVICSFIFAGVAMAIPANALTSSSLLRLMLVVTGVAIIVVSTSISAAVLSLATVKYPSAIIFLSTAVGAFFSSSLRSITAPSVIMLALISSQIGRRALKEFREYTWIRSIAISLATEGGTSFRRADLTASNFFQAHLKCTNLNSTILTHTNWYCAQKLETSRLDETILFDSAIRELIVTHDGIGKSYIGCNLQGANLIGADLTDADLTDADISQATLEAAVLERTNLTKTQALGTKFHNAKLTGACLEAWNIDSTTRLGQVDCEFIYLLNNQQERRPSNEDSKFSPGEFTSLFEKALNAVDLIFLDGVDWQAFFQSFQELRSQYSDQELSIQSIENKRDGAFVIRLEVSPEIDKTVIESRAKELYVAEIKTLEAQYEERLRLQGRHLEDARQTIEVERRDKATLMGVVQTLATSQQGPKYDMRGAQFAGSFAETVQGDQIGGAIHNESAETSSLSPFPSLTEATAEIQNLLTPLKASNPTATQSNQIAFLNLMIPPTRREWFTSALQYADNTGSDGSDAPTNTALEDIPYAPLLKALVKSWQSPGSGE